MSTNPLIARFAGEPALVDQGSAERLTACLTAIAQHPRAQEMITGDYLAGCDFWQEDGGWCRPYIVQDGILQIPVKGVLLNGFPYALYDWATGYEYILEAFKRGCGDYATGAIQGIAFVEDSPGGMVAGCFDAVDKMVDLKTATGVPVRAFAHESAYSAAYAIATVADHVAVSRTGGVGSIGVVTTHLDVSGAMEKAGLKITFIASDPSKVEGNSYEPLSPDAEKRIQARIDELYSIFVAAVSRGRGLEESTIRDTLKAYCYTATQALANGLADSIGTLDDATAAFAAFLDDQSDNQGEEAMADEVKPAVDQAAHETAVADARAAGMKEGASAERARVNAILGSDEGKARPKAALSAALKTDMTVEQAAAFLADLDEEKAETPTPAAPAAQTPFDAAMGKDNPDVGANAGKKKEEASEDSADDLLTLAAAAGLKGFVKA